MATKERRLWQTKYITLIASKDRSVTDHMGNRAVSVEDKQSISPESLFGPSYEKAGKEKQKHFRIG